MLVLWKQLTVRNDCKLLGFCPHVQNIPRTWNSEKKNILRNCLFQFGWKDNLHCRTNSTVPDAPLKYIFSFQVTWTQTHKFILLKFKPTGFGLLFGKYDSTDFDNSCSLIREHTTVRKRTLDVQFNTIHALLLISLFNDKTCFLMDCF